MDVVELERKLLAAGRKHRPSEGVPYAFEKRVMARLRSVKVESLWSFWASALWRGALASLILPAALGVWSLLPREQAVADTELSEVYESTVYAAAEQFNDSW